MNKSLECQYCSESKHYIGSITGKSIKTHELKPTYGYSSRKHPNTNDYLEVFILKGENDKKAGLMIENIIGARYIDINYCPFCGRKVSDNQC